LTSSYIYERKRGADGSTRITEEVRNLGFGDTLVLYSTTPPVKGSATEGVCLRRGFIILETQTGRLGAYPTICKSWSCLSCSKKLLSLFIERAKLGHSKLAPLYFITNTFWMGSQETQVGAKSAERVWREWLKRLRKKHPNLAYLRVVEMTKKGQTHFHSIMGGLGKLKDNCREQKPTSSKHLLRNCKRSPACLEHEMSGLWHKITGDSYWTDVQTVYGITGLCRYLSKYMAKSFAEFERCKAAGFGKRWTQSQNWPRIEKMQLRGTKNKAWKRAIPIHHQDQGVTLAHYLLDKTPDDGDFERVGTELAKEMENYRIAQAQAALVRRINGYDKNEHEKDGPVGSNGRRRPSNRRRSRA